MKKIYLILSILLSLSIFNGCVMKQKKFTNESLTLRKVSVFNEKDIKLERVKKSVE